MMIDYNKVKMGMVLSFRSTGGFIDRRIVGYQRDVGFAPEAASQTHIAVSMGGPYIVEATWPRSKYSDLRVDHQGREITFLYLNNEQFRENCRYKYVVWCATKLNLPYGWKSLFGFYWRLLVPFSWSNPFEAGKTPFCSFLAAWGLRRTGFDPWPGVATDMITPAHFLGCEKFAVIDVFVGDNTKQAGRKTQGRKG